MVKINPTVEVLKLLARADTDTDKKAEEAKKQWQPLHIVLLTNYGDGTAYDIRLSGSDCKPRVWVRDEGETEGDKVVAKLPMWNNRLGSLEPGRMISVVVMSSPDPTPPPVLKVKWKRMPRRHLGSEIRYYDLAKAHTVETGWPGKTDITKKPDNPSPMTRRMRTAWNFLRCSRQPSPAGRGQIRSR
jgi:hypothetical protein